MKFITYIIILAIWCSNCLAQEVVVLGAGNLPVPHALVIGISSKFPTLETDSQGKFLLPNVDEIIVYAPNYSPQRAVTKNLKTMVLKERQGVSYILYQDDSDQPLSNLIIRDLRTNKVRTTDVFGIEIVEQSDTVEIHTNGNRKFESSNSIFLKEQLKKSVVKVVIKRKKNAEPKQKILFDNYFKALRIGNKGIIEETCDDLLDALPDPTLQRVIFETRKLAICDIIDSVSCERINGLNSSLHEYYNTGGSSIDIVYLNKMYLELREAYEDQRFNLLAIFNIDKSFKPRILKRVWFQKKQYLCEMAALKQLWQNSSFSKNFDGCFQEAKNGILEDLDFMLSKLPSDKDIKALMSEIQLITY